MEGWREERENGNKEFIEITDERPRDDCQKWKKTYEETATQKYI